MMNTILKGEYVVRTDNVPAFVTTHMAHTTTKNERLRARARTCYVLSMPPKKVDSGEYIWLSFVRNNHRGDLPHTSVEEGGKSLRND